MDKKGVRRPAGTGRAAAACFMLLVGGLMVLSSRTSSVGIQLVLYGVIIGGIGTLIGTGGIVTWIMGFAGVHAP